MSAPHLTAKPWEQRHLWMFGVGQAVALALLVGACLGASSELRPADQTGWLHLGIVAIATAGVFHGGFLFSGRRTLVRRRRAVFLAYEHPAGPEPSAFGSAASDSLPVAAAAMTRYHRPECLLVAGKPVVGANRAAHAEARRKPCGVCRP